MDTDTFDHQEIKTVASRLYNLTFFLLFLNLAADIIIYLSVHNTTLTSEILFVI